MGEEITIRPARERKDFDACVELQRVVWSLADLEIVSALEMIAAVFSGGMCHIAENSGGRAVGFAFAFPALRGRAAHFHSDMVGVLPELQGQGVGVKLKLQQREDALARGIALITWTFDPMQARNAHLNLRRLGAVGAEFLPNFYGPTTSPLHHGLPTDRLLVKWELNSPRARDRALGGEVPKGVVLPNQPRINEVKWQAGWPVSSEPRTDLKANEALLEVPPEWDILCRAAPRVAQDWHDKVRRALLAYMAPQAYVAADFIQAEEGGRRRPLYVLRRI
jgi:predicted GNAT superfamily acetyltransferase